MIIKRLTDHIDGEIEMATTQVTAALGLLKKSLPDLKATEITGADGQSLFPTDVNVNAVGPKANTGS